MTGYTLAYEGGSLPLPTRPATEGPGGLEVGGLLAKTGHVTLDAGFMNTAACTSAITYIDGDAGILRYRGYPIDQLAGRASFLEVAYLLIYGELPTADELAGFTERVKMHTLLREEMRRFFDGFPRDAHPMAVLSSAVSTLSTFYQDSLAPFDREQVEISTRAAAGQAADHRVVRVQGLDRSTVPVPGQLARLRRELPAHDVRGTDDGVRGRTRYTPGCWTCCSCCTPTTSRTARRRPCGWWARRRRACSPRWRPGSTRCPARCTAAPTRRCWRCSSRSTRPATTPSPLWTR